MISRIIFLIFFMSIPFLKSEIVAKLQAWTWDITIILEGEEYDESCQLKLIAETYDHKLEFDLKNKGYRCALFGPIQIYSDNILGQDTTLVFIEAMQGGDGDHTGPIIQVFQLSINGIKKLGEQELFDATYFRKDGKIISIIGQVLYSLCFVCDGPEITRPIDSFYIQSQITIENSRIKTRPIISIEERNNIFKRFENRVPELIKEENLDKRDINHLKDMKKELKAFLGI